MATTEANKYKEKGNEEFQKGNHAKAIEYYTYATELDPKNPVFLTNRATAYHKMGKYDKALRDAEKAVGLDSRWEKGHYRRGLALQEMGNLDEAMKAFQAAVSLKDDPTYTNALTDCKTKLMKDKSKAEILKMDANDLFKGGKIEDAVKAYTRALDACSNSDKDLQVKADIYANRAACYRNLYHDKEVVADCTEALKIQPDNVKALIRRAQSLESLEKFEEAYADFEKASRLAPGMQVATMGAARIRSSLKRNKNN